MKVVLWSLNLTIDLVTEQQIKRSEASMQHLYHLFAGMLIIKIQQSCFVSGNWKYQHDVKY